ncbi:hypothetical protein TA3x_005114 [Tundrisphaera sp. TA3]|uniref:hypothetical protein n=1 Tax=Tundrisphaera sp. TA3 TaxID=3435775 RepID=UPI003EBE2519
MTAEIQGVADMLAGMTQPDEDPYRLHIPVEEGLIARYGPEVGPRLFASFVDAYESAPSFVPFYPPREMPRSGRRPITAEASGSRSESR